MSLSPALRSSSQATMAPCAPSLVMTGRFWMPVTFVSATPFAAHIGMPGPVMRWAKIPGQPLVVRRGAAPQAVGPRPLRRARRVQPLREDVAVAEAQPPVLPGDDRA